MYKPSERIRDGALYGLYLQVRYPAHARARWTERRFYRSLHGWNGSELVFDIGASRGQKAAIFRRLAKTVICLEPNPPSCAALRARFRGKNVTVVEAAAGERKGVATIHAFADDAEGYNTLSDKWVTELGRARKGRQALQESHTLKVGVTTLDELIQAHGVPSYIKIDVEGFERQVVYGLSISVPLLSFECNLPEFEQETADVVEHLERLRPGSLYNYCLTEPPAAFALDEWIGATALLDVVRAGQISFMEIYCKSDR